MTPTVPAKVSRFMISVFTGSTTEPVSMNSSSSVVRMMIPMTSGRLRPRLSFRSRNSAV